MASVAKVTEITVSSKKSFDDAIEEGIKRASKTLENVSVYANRLQPRFILLDDIRLNAQMRRLWTDLGRWDLGELHDLSDLVDRAKRLDDASVENSDAITDQLDFLQDVAIEKDRLALSF